MDDLFTALNPFFRFPFKKFPDLISGAAALLNELSLPPSHKANIPVGHWRDDVWSIARHGWCHGSVWTACCCLPIASAQVIARLHLTAWGLPHAAMRQRAAIFLSTVTAVAAYSVARVLLFLVIALMDPNTGSTEWKEPGPAYYAACALDDLAAYLSFALAVVQLRNARARVRAVYGIPGSAASDVCCALTCPCLVAAHLLRHTADYEDQPSRWCFTETGLPWNAPSIV